MIKKNRIAVVTGGSGGIGSAISQDLARDHEVVIQYCSSREHAEKTEHEVRVNGGSCMIIQADLSTESGCITFAHKVKESFNGSIDVLVNNAGGIVSRHSISEITWDLIDKHFTLNAYSTIMMSSLLLPCLMNGINPCVVNITSGAVRTGGMTASLYGAAKSAVDSFTRGMAHEVAPKVRVNSVAPGIIDTQFHAETSSERMSQFIASTPLQRVGTPAQIAHVVRFLVENLFITGECVDINGGMLMR